VEYDVNGIEEQWNECGTEITGEKFHIKRNTFFFCHTVKKSTTELYLDERMKAELCIFTVIEIRLRYFCFCFTWIQFLRFPLGWKFEYDDRETF